MSDRLNPALLSTPASETPAAPPVVGHLLQRQALLSRQLAQAAQHGLATAALLPTPRPQTWQELVELQQAVVQQLQQLQQGWVQGWAAWLGEFGQLKRANTMSKLVEQEFNLAGQWLLLLQGQATDLTNLQENIEINYGYWLSQQARR